MAACAAPNGGELWPAMRVAGTAEARPIQHVRFLSRCCSLPRWWFMCGFLLMVAGVAGMVDVRDRISYPVGK